MNKYFYCFGYEDKFEIETNKSTGTDFESSTGVYIFAETEEDALIWGNEVSEQFFKLVHDDINLSWKKFNYAYWIEYDLKNSGWEHCLEFFPEVKCGLLPDLSLMTTEAYVEWCKKNKVKL